MENQIVVFELAAESFGVNIDSVENIIKMQTITRLPHAPEFVEGVINLRGKILAVVDLRKRFGFAAREIDRNSRIIVTSVDGTEIGMIVDGVSEVLTVCEQDIEVAPAIALTMESIFITGIAKINQRLVIFLDLAKTLSFQEQQALAVSILEPAEL